MSSDSAHTVPSVESLTVEFKSDRKGLSDSDIVLAAVCLANAEGGHLYLGIENDGRVTGVQQPQRRNVHGLAALIANTTSPSLSVRVRVLEVGKHTVTEIEVPRSRQLVGTREGRYQRRVLKADGTPECIGMPPYEIASRLAEIGQLDYSAQPLPHLDREAFDPVERERLRRLIAEFNGDKSLLGLNDADFDAALGLTARDGKRLVPTIAGILLQGKAAVLEEQVPTHEVAFQLLRSTQVVINEFYKWPLGRVFERMMDHLRTIVVEQEVMVGLFRVAVPSIDRNAFREALVNALTHRDYARLGQIYVRVRDDELTISSPGGFMQGVTLENLLRVEPIPRNPRLADAFKRLGLSERTGRGVDIIYEGALRYGRPPPSYRGSTAQSVMVAVDARPADLKFVQAVVQEERRRGRTLSVDALIILGKLKDVKRAAVADLAEALQSREVDDARRAVEELVESGLVQAHGTGKGRTYTMSAQLYRQLGQKSQHIRQTGLEAEQQRQMVLKYVKEHGSIKRAEVMELCALTADQAKHMLAKLVEDGRLKKHGERRHTYYKRP